VSWTPFYAAMVGASAAVMALLFVAVQLIADRLPADIRDGWQSVAFCTFYLFLTAFFLPLWFLIPSFDPHGRSVIAFIVAVIGIVRSMRASIPLWQGVLRIGHSRRREMLWYVAGPLTLYVLIVYESAKAYFGHWSDSTEQNVAIFLTILFSLALRNSWDLFTEAAFRPAGLSASGDNAKNVPQVPPTQRDLDVTGHERNKD
jgi:hypothetical protein